MKLSLSPVVRKILKIISLIILIVTVVTFWSFLAYAVLIDSGSDVASSDQDDYCNVAKVDLYGDLYTYIREDENCPGCSSSEDIVNQIRAAEKNSDIKAILLAVDSTGGAPVSAQEIANALKRAQKPTAAWIRESGMSAAYFAATGANRIIASDFSDVGSIGITSSYVDNSVKNQKEGLTFNQLSIGKYKDTGNANKPLTADERKMAMADLQVGYNIFVNSVTANRHLDVAKVRALADGNTMKGQKALENGLIDQIGGIDEVLAYLKDRILEEPILCQ